MAAPFYSNHAGRRTHRFGTPSDANAPVTYRDKFGVFFDYAAGGGAAADTGTLITSTQERRISRGTAIHNPVGGGTPAIRPSSKRAGLEYAAEVTQKPDVLFIEDLVLQPNTNASLGMGVRKEIRPTDRCCTRM